jgi:hypothetical protein
MPPDAGVEENMRVSIGVMCGSGKKSLLKYTKGHGMNRKAKPL